MATIYDGETAVTITECLQGSTVCDEAIQAAKRIAADREEDVILDDDDGYWLVSQDGTVREIEADEAKSIGFDPHSAWTREYLRYRIDASREINGALHTASEVVDQEWHDSEDEAVEYAESLLEDDEDLILTVGEYAIDSAEEPSESEWSAMRTRAPRREINVEVEA
jgi:hypothetical protein